MHKNNKNFSKGYSLVELSIVLIILAVVVVAGVKGGSLIDAFRAQNTVSSMQKYKAAYDDFKSRYDSVPGDMADATTVWAGSANINNGDGDGRIETAVSSSVSEEFQAWYHLNLAGLGVFPGTGLSAASGSASYASDTNVPIGAYSGSVYRMYSSATISGYSGTAPINFVELSAANGTSASVGILKPIDAEYVDQKIDDGLPSSGVIRGAEATTGFGGTTIGANTCTYTVSSVLKYQKVVSGTTKNITRSCILRYMLGAY